MSQHDFVIADQTFPATRADINLALLAAISNSQGATAPSTTYAYQLWLDTNATPWLLKIRNAADDAWITLMRIDDSDDTASIDADNVDITDAGGFYTGTEVEAGLQEAAVITQGQHTIWVPAGAMTSRTTSGAASGSLEATTNLQMIETFDFDTAADEFVQFSVQMPKSWDLSTLIAEFIWSNLSGTGTVAWGIQAVALADSDVIDVAFPAALVTTDTVLTAGDLHISDETTAVTVNGSPAVEELVYFQISRDVSADSLAVDARLHGVKIHYTTDANTDS